MGWERQANNSEHDENSDWLNFEIQLVWLWLIDFAVGFFFRHYYCYYCSTIQRCLFRALSWISNCFFSIGCQRKSYKDKHLDNHHHHHQISIKINRGNIFNQNYSYSILFRQIYIDYIDIHDSPVHDTHRELSMKWPIKSNDCRDKVKFIGIKNHRIIHLSVFVHVSNEPLPNKINRKSNYKQRTRTRTRNCIHHIRRLRPNRYYNTTHPYYIC